MEPLIIKKTEQTPAIIFIPKNETFQIAATSWPEDAKNFYEPIYEWISDYFNNNPLEQTNFQFFISYMNTSSAKQIVRILTLLKKLSQKHNISIKWYYDKGDLDMANEGKRYMKILNFKNFEVIERIANPKIK
jgi:hypothetical protein